MGILKEQFNHGGVTKSGLLIDGVKQDRGGEDQQGKNATEGNAKKSEPPPVKPGRGGDKDENSVEAT